MKKKFLLPIVCTSLFLTGCQAGSVTLEKANPFNKFIGNSSDLSNREKALNVKIAEEGFVLLKNKDDVLPFGSNVKKISIFGKASDDMAANGGGSGGGGSIGTTMQ